MVVERDEDGYPIEPCLSCDKSYIEDIWNELCCDEKICDKKKGRISMNCGYRTESYGGSKVRNLKKILMFEILELDNIGIFQYIYDNYIKEDFNENYEEDIKTYINELPKFLYVVNSYPCNKTWTDEDIEKLVNNTIKYLAIKFNCKEDDLVGLWLCDSIKDIAKYYWVEDDRNEAISVYDNDYNIRSHCKGKICDLANQGSLYVYCAEPLCMYTIV